MTQKYITQRRKGKQDRGEFELFASLRLCVIRYLFARIAGTGQKEH
jgi:hypothetical protein